MSACLVQRVAVYLMKWLSWYCAVMGRSQLADFQPERAAWLPVCFAPSCVCFTCLYASGLQGHRAALLHLKTPAAARLLVTAQGCTESLRGGPYTIFAKKSACRTCPEGRWDARSTSANCQHTGSVLAQPPATARASVRGSSPPERRWAACLC